MVNRETCIPPRELFIGLGWDRDDVVLKNPNGEDTFSRAGSIASAEEAPEKEPLLGDKRSGSVESQSSSASTKGS